MEILDISTKRGETWSGFVLTLTDSLSAPINLTDSTITLDVKYNPCDTDAVLSFSSVDDTINITKPLSGEFQVLPVVIDITPKSYQYDLKIVLSDATVLYPIGGKFTVQQNVTR